MPIKDRSWKKADYPNARPKWHKHLKIKEPKKTQLERVLASLDYEKLATVGK